MTEKEKMIQGKPYKANDEQLFQERQYAKEVLYTWNALPPTELTKRHDVLKDLLGHVEDNFFIEPPFRCDYGYNISVGDNFYANYNCTILDCAPVTIGNNVMLAPNVCLFTAGHPIHAAPRIEGWEHACPITIGDNVWIGGGAIINPGVSIGDNTVIGAGSVVTKDIPANVVAVGNPCRVMRDITDDDRTTYFRSLTF
ncbi:sugar O-acetyltransferase [Lentibacillus saliphilus]|uniref:sugar O-acetyltransferase n=1 Tax=Lentibacillus saliphilus TaxID=2737028 RepID=UPI001C30E8B5|nr:sugar O-acetyltransferase [Lentibacillus saliphilus]